MKETLNLVVLIINILGSIIMLMLLFEYKYSKKTTIICFSIGCVVLTINSTVCFLLFGGEFIAKYCLLINALPVSTLVYFISKQSLLKWLFNIFSQFNAYFAILGISVVLNRTFFGPSPIALVCLVTFFYTASILVIVFFLLKPYLIVLNSLSNKSFVTLLLVALGFNVIFAFLLPIFAVEPPVSKEWVAFYFLVSVLLVLVYSVIFTTLRYMFFDFENKNDQIRIKAQENLLISQLDAQKSLIEATKIHRHDLRHHNQVIFEYLAKNDIAGAKAYLKEYDQFIDIENTKEYCKNSMANAVIGLYAAKAEKEMIDFQVTGDIPDNIQISNTDISTIFSNILENAYDSCKKAEVDSFINLFCQTDNNKLKISLTNTLSEKIEFKNGMPQSSKSENGGMGLTSVRYAVEKYNGMIYCKAEDNQFLTQIILSAGN